MSTTHQHRYPAITPHTHTQWKEKKRLLFSDSPGVYKKRGKKNQFSLFILCGQWWYWIMMMMSVYLIRASTQWKVTKPKSYRSKQKKIKWHGSNEKLKRSGSICCSGAMKTQVFDECLKENNDFPTLQNDETSAETINVLPLILFASICCLWIWQYVDTIAAEELVGFFNEI